MEKYRIKVTDRQGNVKYSDIVFESKEICNKNIEALIFCYLYEDKADIMPNFEAILVKENDGDTQSETRMKTMNINK